MKINSRSEFRLSVRADNADVRLTRRGYAVGCVSEARRAMFEETEVKMQHCEYVFS